MEISGQIMYDTLNSSTLKVSRGNQCSTLDRRRSLPYVSQGVNYSGSVNYDTGKRPKLLSGNVGIKIHNVSHCNRWLVHQHEALEMWFCISEIKTCNFQCAWLAFSGRAITGTAAFSQDLKTKWQNAKRNRPKSQYKRCSPNPITTDIKVSGNPVIGIFSVELRPDTLSQVQRQVPFSPMDE